jgi:hypothetical protein
MAITLHSTRFGDDPLLVEILNDPDTGTRKLGSHSPPASVMRLQQALWDLGWVARVEPTIARREFVIGAYGPITRKTVVAYKTNYGIHYPPDAPTGFIDAYAGPRTLARLDRHCALLDAAISAFTKLEADDDSPFALVVTSGRQRVHPVPGTRGCTTEMWSGEVPIVGYHHPDAGTFGLQGELEEHYRLRLGGPTGPLGFPTSDAAPSPQGMKISLQCGELWRSSDGLLHHTILGVADPREDPDDLF